MLTSVISVVLSTEFNPKEVAIGIVKAAIETVKAAIGTAKLPLRESKLPLGQSKFVSIHWPNFFLLKKDNMTFWEHTMHFLGLEQLFKLSHYI